MSRASPHPSGGKDLPEVAEVEQLEELGDDAIIAHQQGAHAPQPRAQVTEEARSVVISDHPPVGSDPPPAQALPRSPKRRSERTEKTVVIRDRRQVEELRRQMAKRGAAYSSHPPPSAVPGLWVWVAVGLAAFLMGGLAALFATRDEDQASVPAASSLPASALAPSVPAATSEPPKVSIDELPVEDAKK